VRRVNIVEVKTSCIKDMYANGVELLKSEEFGNLNFKGEKRNVE